MLAATWAAELVTSTIGTYVSFEARAFTILTTNTMTRTVLGTRLRITVVTCPAFKAVALESVEITDPIFAAQTTGRHALGASPAIIAVAVPSKFGGQTVPMT